MSFWMVQEMSYLDFRERCKTCINSEKFNTGTTKAGRHISKLLAPGKSKFILDLSQTECEAFTLASATRSQCRKL